MDKKMKLLVIIPALNEEHNVGRLINDIPKKIEGVSEIDILVIDDGSNDNTAQVAQVAGAQVIRNQVNLGLGLVFDIGLQYAIEKHFDLMVNIDGDGRFDPSDIEKLIKPILNNQADFVTASRFIDKDFHPKMPLMKFWGNKMMSYLISKLIGKRFFDVSCGFRAYSKEVLLSLNLQGEFTYTQETFLNLAFNKRLRIMEVPVRVKYYKSRRSKIAGNLISYGINTAKIIFRTYRDYKPLKFFFGIASLFFIIGFFFELILLRTFILTGRFSPNIWSGFVGAVFFFISIMFFVVGVLADMNTRIRINQERILYHIKKYNLYKKIN